MNSPDAIDALVDEQLARECERVMIHPCRCGRPWHGLPQQVVGSLAVCAGTHVVGERRP
ncbi:hypothetical protein [Rhodococcus jostii]|uniref:hypothetical protein n=1 Tax=Rhodococcus jostii TaxID=132919 RepID=UPI00362E6AD5